MFFEEVSRRQALSAAALSGAAMPLLAACGDDTSTATEDPSGSTGSTSSPEGTPDAGGQGFASTADVPVGGATVYQDEKLVVTQPVEGEFKCFSAVCTHQGCLVSSGSPDQGVIPCDCHGSQFSLEDGSVVQGPATAALSEVAITVDGTDIATA